MITVGNVCYQHCNIKVFNHIHCFGHLIQNSPHMFKIPSSILLKTSQPLHLQKLSGNVCRDCATVGFFPAGWAYFQHCVSIDNDTLQYNLYKYII